MFNFGKKNNQSDRLLLPLLSIRILLASLEGGELHMNQFTVSHWNKLNEY